MNRHLLPSSLISLNGPLQPFCISPRTLSLPRLSIRNMSADNDSAPISLEVCDASELQDGAMFVLRFHLVSQTDTDLLALIFSRKEVTFGEKGKVLISKVGGKLVSTLVLPLIKDRRTQPSWRLPDPTTLYFLTLFCLLRYRRSSLLRESPNFAWPLLTSLLIEFRCPTDSSAVCTREFVNQ